VYMGVVWCLAILNVHGATAGRSTGPRLDA